MAAIVLGVIAIVVVADLFDLTNRRSSKRV
jgi:hypothetical protein